MLKPDINAFSNELHSLRGIAALIVLFSHLRRMFCEDILHTDFPHIFNGSACVILFFVLSGLVVTSSILKVQNEKNFLLTYYLRRIFRLMPLMLVTVTVGGLYVLMFHSTHPLSIYKREWGDFSYSTWLVSYVGYSLKGNPPAWSIWVELVASLLLPLFLLVNKNKTQLMIAFVALVFLTFVPVPLRHYWHFYLVSFFCGATILYWGRTFSTWFTDAISNKNMRYGIIAIFAMLFYFPRLLFPAQEWFGNNLIILWETAFITPLIALIYYKSEMFTLLKHKSLVFLGNISFSIYLNHMILMVAFFNIYLLNFELQPGVLLGLVPLYLVVVVVVSNFTFQYVELKGSALGQKFINKLGIKKPTSYPQAVNK